MANKSKKPSISRASKTPSERNCFIPPKKAKADGPAEELYARVNLLEGKVQKLEAPEVDPATHPLRLIAAALERIAAALEAKPAVVQLAGAPGSVTGEVAPAKPPKEKKPDRANCKHLSCERVNPKLTRCIACQAVLDDPETPAAPPPPAFEVFREAAVAYAQKHGKAKMLEAVKPFVEGEEIKLSLVPESKRAAAMAALQEA